MHAHVDRPGDRRITHDHLNRITSIVSPTPALSVAYTYDTTEAACQAGETFNIGRLTKIVDASSSTVYCHDRFGHMVRKIQTTNGTTFVLRYAFNVAGQPTDVVYPDGTVIDYGYDSRGRAVEVGVTPSGGARQIVLSSATYYPFGPVSQWTYGNGRVMKRGLNRNYQPGFVEVTGAGGLSVGYEFDAAGNLVRLRTADQAEPPARAYAYDGLNRLTQAKDGVTDTVLEAYAYDSTGNRTSATVGGTTTAYSYGGTSHRLNAAGAVTRSYDAAGNTTQIGANKTFVYDDLGRMRQVLESGVVTRNYAYNGLGQQVRTWAAANDDRYSMYGEEGQWLGEYDSTGAPRQQIVWFNGLPVAVLTGSGTAQKVHSIEADALGTPRVVVDPTRGPDGTAIWRWDLTGEAFGNTPPNEDPDGDGTPFVFDMRFPGQRYDAATGLSYNYFRDYEPGTGRYVESDPIGLMGGVSTYGHVGGKPLNFIDPSGLAVAIPYSPPVPGIPWGWVRAVGGRAGGVGAAAGAGWWIGTKVHDRYETQISSAVDSVVDTCAKLARPKCLPATTANIVGALSTSEMISQQPTVSMTFIQMYVLDIEGGVPLPPIRVDGNIIVDGNHRYIAHRLCRMEAARQEWVSSPSAMRVPMQLLIIQP